MKTTDEVIQKMKAEAEAAAKKAYCPYSSFPVGAAVLTENNELFAGCNVENASLGLTSTKHLIDAHFAVAIEDDREQGYAFHSNGVKVFLLAHPWNEVGPHSPLNRVENWEQLAEELFLCN